jgi:hypothetical protein
MIANIRIDKLGSKAPHRLLPSSSPGLLRDSDPAQNADKTQTKCRQNLKCKFFNTYLPTTYNFNPLTCLNSAVPHLNLNHPLNLNPLNSCQLVFIRGHNPKLTRTDRFRPKSPGPYYTNKPIYSPSMSCLHSQLSASAPQRLNSHPRSYELKKPDHFQTVQRSNFAISSGNHKNQTAMV